MRECQGLGFGSVRDLLHAEQQDEEYFGGLREAVLERDGTAAGLAMLLVVTSGRSSFITGYPGIRHEPDAVALSWLPSEGPPGQSCTLRHAAACPGTMERAAPPTVMNKCSLLTSKKLAAKRVPLFEEETGSSR